MRRRELLRATGAGLGLVTVPTLATGANEPPPTDESSTAAAGHARESLEPLSRLPVTGGSGEYQATEAVVAPDGRYAFVSKLTGFHVFDVSDPGNPEVVATVEDILADEGGPMETIYDIKYSRGRLLVVSNSRGTYPELALFDVRDPADPRLLSSYETGYGVHNCFLYGEYAYLTTGSTLEIVDAGADEPDVVGQWRLADHDENYADVSSLVANLHDMYVQDGRAYLAYWDAGTWILDVSDPADPSYVGHVADHTIEDLVAGATSSLLPPGNDHYVQPNDDGTVMAVGKESWGTSGDDDSEPVGGPSGIDLYDIADPTDPTRLATIDPPPVPEGEAASYVNGYWTTAHNFDIVGDTLYSSWYRGGVKIHDISDPGTPEELASWADGESAEMWTAQAGVPGDFFVASSLRHPTDPEGSGALYVFPDPSNSDAVVTPAGPEVAVPTPTPTLTSAPTSTPIETETPTGTPSPTPTPTSTPTPSPTQTPTPTETPTVVDENGSGFGALVALGATALGAWRVVDDDTG